ncbi:MAG: SDR family NAD(P)-dependent oxidoreductase, partial [Gemmatimonadota bacterium]
MDAGAGVALVAGASRGVGRGVASELSRRGWRVYGTGRSIEGAKLPDAVRRVRCDHTVPSEVAALFEVVEGEAGRLDVLVNSVWGGYERMVEDGEFTWPRPFWRQPTWRWDAMMEAGVRAAYTTSQGAARLMAPAGRGLIVHLSHWA